MRKSTGGSGRPSRVARARLRRRHGLPDVPAADNMPYAGFFPTDFTKLPTFSFVVPNLIDDMHDGTVSQGDTWLKNNVEAYRQWAQTHNSLLIMTFDEDSSGNNQVATIFDGQMVKPGQYNEYLDHFGVLRTVEDMYGLPHAGASATATPISDIFVSQSTQSLHQQRATLVMAGNIGAGKTNHEALTINCESLSGAGFVDRFE